LDIIFCDEGGETPPQAAPSLAVFKARLDGAWSSLVWWKVSLLMVVSVLSEKEVQDQIFLTRHCLILLFQHCQK